MSTVESQTESVAEIEDFVDYRFTTDLYKRLFELDILGHKAPCFLWDGKLVEKEELPGYADLRPYRIGRDRFEKMVAAGIFGNEVSIFLWQGRLVRKMTAGHAHFITVSLLYQVLLSLVAPAWTVIQEQPVEIDEWSLPEPDLSIIRGSLNDYRKRRPNALDLGLVIEVADSSLLIDRRDKLRVYAQARLPRYWIINIPDRRIETYEMPINQVDGPGYATRRDYLPGQSVPVVLDQSQIGLIAVNEILPA